MRKTRPKVRCVSVVVMATLHFSFVIFAVVLLIPLIVSLTLIVCFAIGSIIRTK